MYHGIPRVVDQSRRKLLTIRVVERRLRLAQRASLVSVYSTDSVEPEICSRPDSVTRLRENKEMVGGNREKSNRSGGIDRAPHTVHRPTS